MAYDSILNWIDFFADPMANPYYPFASYNLPFDIGYRLWEIIGGTIAWLINLLFPGNPVSTWLMCDATCTLFALLIFMLLVFIVAFVSTLIVLWMSSNALMPLKTRSMRH